MQFEDRECWSKRGEYPPPVCGRVYRTLPKETRATCDNCGWRGASQELAWLRNANEWLTEGDTVAAGECPRCHFQVFTDWMRGKWAREGEQDRAAKAMLAALRSVRIYLGDDGTDNSPEARAARADLDSAIATAKAAGI